MYLWLKYIKWNDIKARIYLISLLVIFAFTSGPIIPRGLAAGNSFGSKYRPNIASDIAHKSMKIDGSFLSGCEGSGKMLIENYAIMVRGQALIVIKGEIRFKAERSYGECHKIMTRCLIKCALLFSNGKLLTFHCRYLKTWCNIPVIPE